MNVDVLVWPFTLEVIVTDLPLWSASTSCCTVSSEQARSPTWVSIRCTTAGPCASSCCTNVVTCDSVVVDVEIELFCVDWLVPASAVEVFVVVLRLGAVDENAPELVVWLPVVFSDPENEPAALPAAEPLAAADPAASRLTVALPEVVGLWLESVEPPDKVDWEPPPVELAACPDWDRSVDELVDVDGVVEPLLIDELVEPLRVVVEGWVPVEELEVCACRPSAAAKSAVAPQAMSLLGFFIMVVSVVHRRSHAAGGLVANPVFPRGRQPSPAVSSRL